MSFDLSDYVDVAERERLLFERHPDARVQVELEDVRDGSGQIVAWKAKAMIWRTPEDPIPVCDYAVEPVPGKTPYTRDSEAMNASTSAVGRAIVLAGFPSKKIASAEEVRARENDGEEAQPERITDTAYQAYLEATERAMQEDTKPSDIPIHFGKNKGTKLGDLTPRQLAWYANDWKLQDTPSEYDHRLKAAAVALHAGENIPIPVDPYPDVPF